MMAACRLARGVALTGAALVLALTAVACVPLPAPQAQTTPPAPRDTTRSVAAPAVAAGVPARAAAVDSGPSPDARHVLDAIPEPLGPGERVPPPDHVTAPPPDSAAAPATPSAPDSSRDSTHVDVPVPAPTRPLGDRPAAPSAPDTAASATPNVTPPPAAPAAPAQPAAPAAPDTCWRVQVAAPAEAAKAARLRDAAQSQLLVPMVIEHEKHLYKVRTRDCWERTAAEGLKARAVGSGFAGAFIFVGARP